MASSKGKTWPATSDREFTKRMFKKFMWAFFIHVLITVASEVYLVASGMAYGQPTAILIACIPVYSAIFLGVITKSGVENVYKGKSETATVVIGKQSKTAAEPSQGSAISKNG